MQENSQYLKADLRSWVLGTIRKIEKGIRWNIAWQDTYREIRGKKPECGRKGCPTKAAETLYELGCIRCGNKSFKNLPLKEVVDNYSKNGVYAVLAFDYLNQGSDTSTNELWNIIRKRFKRELGEASATSDQGGTTVAYKLWHLGLIIESASE